MAKPYWQLKAEELETAGKTSEAQRYKIRRPSGPGATKFGVFDPLAPETPIEEPPGGNENGDENGDGKKEPLVFRYGGDKIGELMKGLDITAPTAKEEADIRAQQREAVQAQIDAINAMYARLITGEEEKGERELGRTRALMSYAGLLGMPRAGAQAEKVRGYTKEATELLESKRGLEIAVILDKADSRAVAEIEAKRQEALGNRDAYINYLTGVRTEVRTDMKALAQSGVSLDRLKESVSEEGDKYYDQLLEETGWDSFVFDSVYNLNLAEGTKVDYQYYWKGDNLVGIGQDPLTGKIKTETYTAEELDIPTEVVGGKYSPKVADDGTILFYPDQFNLDAPEGKTLEEHIKDQIFVYGKFAKPEEPEKPLTLSDTDLRKLVIAGVPEDIGSGMFEDFKNGFSWDEVEQNLIDQFGEEQGKKYLAAAKPILEETGVIIKIITGE